jgi:hypothetical protein
MADIWSDMRLLKWMAGVNLALLVVVLLLTFDSLRRVIGL